MNQRIRCAIYTRKSTDEGLERTFNSLDAQREACESYIKSQQHQGWQAISTQYDDGNYSGGNMERPALRQIMADIEAGKVGVGWLFFGIAATAGVEAYLSTPSGQWSASTFTSAAGASISNSISSIKSFFSSKSSSSNPAPATGQQASQGGQNNPTGPAQPKSNPMQGEPGSTSTTTQPDGTPKQTRGYGSDGYPQTDVDSGHDHKGQGDPHAHD
ncbi:MAG TPA: recombinase family protein [Silvibacterium sp.]|nr:recombinase family protein [Silvibacterium sp.]